MHEVESKAGELQVYGTGRVYQKRLHISAGFVDYPLADQTDPNGPPREVDSHGTRLA